ncbi:hypothetical protein [Rummeliibacillus sp. BSL5]
MPIKIAVICSSAFRERLESIAQEVSNIQLEFYIYQAPNETPNLMKQVKPCDALLLSGTLPYLYAKPLLHDWPIPWTYLKQDEAAISTSLLSVLSNYRVPISDISIDVMNTEDVRHVLNDIQYSGEPPFIQEIELESSFEQIKEAHQQLWHKGKAKFIITSIHQIYDDLVSAGIPAIRMQDPNSTIIQHLKQTKSLSKMLKSESAKAVVGIMTFKEQEKENQLLLQQVTSTIHATYQKIDDYHFEVFTTYGHLYNALQYSLLEQALHSSSTSAKLTFGYGTSIREAKQNASQALQFAEYNTILIMNEEKELIQYPHPEMIKLSLKTKDPYVLQMAKETKLSPQNISKIMAFSTSRKSLQFTAQDLTDYLQVTRRTTERILKKLVDNGYAVIVGEEMLYQQGRPRAVYELNFSTYS